MEKELTKGKSRVIFGVCSGIAEYFDWDTTWVRLGTVAIACCACPGLIPLYLVAAAIMPKAEV